jgi:tetratricopeptide (TPR) repeat protein
MFACATPQPITTNIHLTRLASSMVLLVLVWSGPLSAEVAPTDIAQSELIKKSAIERSAILAAFVRTASKSRNCASAKASLEKTFDDRSGAWLVLCEEGQDYWAVVRDQPKSAVMVLPCILAQRSGIKCYANVRTVLPEDIKQCAPPSGSLDRVIRSCTAIIQSHQFDNKPDAIFRSYEFRAVAFGGYQQYDLAIADFDKAVALRPGDVQARFNRAVTFERKGEFDQALMDLAEVIKTWPNEVNGLFERGYVYLKKGDYDRAIDGFDQALRIDPQYEKAIRSRAEAVKAKENSAQPSAKIVPVEAPSLPATPDQQAAYCLEASFSFAQRLTKLVETLRANRDKGQALLNEANMPPTEKVQLVAQITALNDSIASNDAKRAAWAANASVFATYVLTHDLFAKDRNMMVTMSGQVRTDQEAVHDTYSACMRGCAPNDASCKSVCDQQANNSDANRRMQRCSDMVVNFQIAMLAFPSGDIPAIPNVRQNIRVSEVWNCT